MEFTIRIDCVNDAFVDNVAGEIARILRAAADRLDADGPSSFGLRDLNGNLVGTATLLSGD